jgi:hypothetical protein
MAQPLPLELEFELTKIYQQINQRDEESVKSILKIIVRNLYVAAMFYKEFDFFAIQKEKIAELVQSNHKQQSREEEIKMFLRSIGIPETKINSILELVNS